MKILFLCHRVPYPATSGSKIRPFNAIRHLTAQGHRVTVASLARDAREAEEAGGLAGYCERVLLEVIPDPVGWARAVARLPSASPSSFGYFFSPALARRVAAELAQGSYDLVFVHCSSMGDYVLRARGPLMVLDYCDMDSQKWRAYAEFKPFPLSLGFRLEAAKLERAERRLAQHFDLCTCATRAELATLRSLGVSTESDWFANGVDGALFTPEPQYDPALIAFVGRMDYYPNEEAVLKFCAQVLPRLQQRRPQLRFSIVGAEPPASIRDLERLPGVSVTGTVPDVRPLVGRAALTVAPLAIARGTQNKILESMAMGVPVVCSVAAARGVDAVEGEHLLSASSTSEYVAAIERILDSPALRLQLAAAARARVLSHHAWSSAMARLDALIAAAFERRAAARASPGEAAAQPVQSRPPSRATADRAPT